MRRRMRPRGALLRRRESRYVATAAAVAALVVLGIAAWCGGEPSASSPGPRATVDIAPSPVATTGADADITCGPPYPIPPYTAETVVCADPAPLTPADLIRVIDGDTIVVRVAGVEETVRVFGIDTPERGDVCFREASDRMAALAGRGVRLRADERERDRFGRRLGYVYTPEGLSIDALLISEGLAHAWRDDGALRVPLMALEDDARASGAGCLWR